MKKLIKLFALFLSIFIYSQDPYQNGFSAGYKAGYCYNILGCVAPVAPIGYRDINNDYQSGYNNGFVKGQQDHVSQSSSYNTGGVQGQLRPSVPDMDLNIDPNNMREMWANYYEKRKRKKEAKLRAKLENDSKQNSVLIQLIADRTLEVVSEMDKLKIRLKNKNMSDTEIENIIYDLHYENQTIYNTYKNDPNNYPDFYVKNKKLKEKISKM